MENDSVSSDSDDYDIPLANLGKTKVVEKQVESESEAEFVSEEEIEEEEEDQNYDESDDNDVSLVSKGNSKTKGKKPSSKSKRNENLSDSDDFIDDDDILSNPNDSEDYSDSDDDCAISSLKSPSSKKSSNKPPKKKAKVTKTTKKKSSSKKKKTVSTKKKAKSSTSTSRSGPLLASTELYAKCPKGKLVQAVLCRWWYAYTWPDISTLPKHPPKKYDALDGFPGVYICTSGDEIGKIMDLRDKATCPSFTNFAKKSSEELRTLLLEAIENQKEALVETEGEGTKTEEDLNALRKWATKLNTSKADKEAAKVLRASGLSL